MNEVAPTGMASNGTKTKKPYVVPTLTHEQNWEIVTGVPSGSN